MNKFEKSLLILNHQERKNAIKVFFLIVAGTLLEMLGIGLIIPLIKFVNNIESLNGIFLGNQIYEYFSEFNKTQLATYAFALFLIIAFLKMIGLAAIIKYQTNFTYNLLTSISSRLFLNYLNKDYSFFLKNNSSYLVKNTLTETQLFITHIVSPFITIITGIMVLMGILVILIFIDFIGTLVISGLMALFGVVFFISIRKRLKTLGGERIYYEGQRLKFLTEGYNSIKEIKITGREIFYYNNYYNSVEKSINATAGQVYINQIPRLILEFLGVFVICIYIFLQIWRGVVFEDLIGVLIVYAIAAFRLMPSVNRVIGGVSAIQFSKDIIDHIYVDNDKSQYSKENQKEIGSFQTLNAKKLSYFYDNGVVGLNKIDLIISKGEMIALIGTSGSGKTTLINVLMGLLPVSNGSLSINNIDIKECNINWMKKIGYVGQNINLIDDTIVNNIAFGVLDQDIDINRINELVDILNMRDFINKFDTGLYTRVGDKGTLLSGGQKQRICIARALYNYPEVLILDEATSALDNETEKTIMESINLLKGKITIIFITHRISTIEYCDKTVRLDSGSIVDQVGL